MPRRSSLAPSLSDPALTTADVLAHVGAWRDDSRDVVQAIEGLRHDAQAASPRLENPTSVLEYLDFFADFITRAADELDRVVIEASGKVRERHVDALRQIASNAALEQRRCLMFRDKWINRPLPYEDVRPLLTRISRVTRDQLNDYRELATAAERLETLSPPEPERGGAIDRRALFSRFLRRDPDNRT